MPYISVVIPVFKTEKHIKDLYERLKKTLTEINSDFEIIFVNDGSPDDSLQIIKDLNQKDKRVKGINFSRNFGQHFAITAGLTHAQGKWVVVMDGDLQDCPEDIKKLHQTVQKGFDAVFGRRVQRQDKFSKKITSKIFYSIYNYFVESKHDSTVANFSITKSALIENFRKLREHSRSFPLIINWMGYNIGYIDVNHGKRTQENSSYNLRKLCNLAIDSIVSQSNKPLKLSIKLGFVISALSILYALFLIVSHLLYSKIIPGWTSLMVSIFFSTGLILANMGILGLYVGKTFDETKNRPLYIIRDIIGNLPRSKDGD